jgi:thioredoxin reductase (NADPH)
VYGGSEGLRTLLVEKRAPGGQAGTSSRIENYLGFPSGLSGAELTRRAVTQAARFGVEILSSQEVTGVRLQDQYKILTISDGAEIVARSLIICTGVSYRTLEGGGLDRFAGAGVYYGAATTEANACAGKDVYVVGGGNSAGQGAMYLSRFAANVYIVIRRTGLEETMSQYLIDQIAGTPNIHLLAETVVREAEGDDHLERIVLEHIPSGECRGADAGALFVFIGAKPITGWLDLNVIRDDKGFLETGRNLFGYDSFKKSWKLDRDPYLLETCIPGIFAAGDVRATAMNRVASAVGEGAMAISFVHRYLGEG